jgi:AmiR/NasT family two-component response regulator
MANAQRHHSRATLAGPTRSAMDSRAVLEQAKGIIMAERRCTADEAFTILAKLAEYSHRDIHDVAAALTDAAVRPLKG